MTDPADPVKFKEKFTDPQEWWFRVFLSDEKYDWLDEEAERRGYGKNPQAHPN